MKNEKLAAKDFITLGVFSILFIILFFICIMCASFVPFTQPFGVAAAGVLTAPVYMLMRAKVNKFGGILIGGILFALIMMLTGSGWPMVLAIMIGTVIAEFISKAGNYRNHALNTIGFVVYMTAAAIGSYTPLLTMKDYYLSLSASNSIENDFMIKLMEFINGPVLICAFIVTAICAVIGAMMAKAMLKKHFVKAGIIKED